jgi:hypothetical protein
MAVAARIDWEKLLSSHRIEYKFQGKNVYVKCPWCGAADSGHHMGIALSSNAWGCWRNASHRGRSPVKLLMALLRISYEVARELAGFDEQYVDPDSWDQLKHNLFNKKVVEQPTTEKTLTFPANEFIEIQQDKLRTARFFDYLVGRGFRAEHIPDLCKKYSLKAAVSGRYKDRVIIPYYVERGLVAWTGRSVLGADLRYLDLPKDESVVFVKNTLYNFNCTRRGADTLLVCEGPFDAITLDFVASKYDVRAVALSTNSITEQQTYLLEEVSVNFRKVLMMMDGANSLGVIDSMHLKESLSHIKNIGFVEVPFGRKDGGEMTASEITSFAKSLVN